MSAAGKKILFNALYVLVLLAIVFGTWAIAAAAIGSQYILPDIGATFAALGTLFANVELWKGLLGTLARTLISYAISIAVFFALFFLSSAFEGCRRVITPLVAALRTLPTMAVALVFAIWAGARYTPVILGITVIVPQLFSSVWARNATLPKELGEVARICGANKVQTFVSYDLPHAAAAFPETFSGALSFDIKIVIAAEILMQTASSLGMLMSLAQMYLKTAELIAMTFIAVVVSVALELSLRAALSAALSRFREE